MSKVTFEEDELAVVALFQENTRKDTIDILKDALEALEETKEDPLEDDLLETIASAIGKMCIRDRYMICPEVKSRSRDYGSVRWKVLRS